MSANQNSRVWQIGSGPVNPSYRDVYLRYGVALIGPGSAGRWRPGRIDAEFGGPFVKWLASEMKSGDIILLRTSQSTIVAVGIVAGEYEYLSQFDDVKGWDLMHARRVRWRALPREHRFSRLVFGSDPPPLLCCEDEEVVGYAARFVDSLPSDWQATALPPLPEEEPLLENPPMEVREITDKVRDLASLYWDRKRFGFCLSREELVVHIVAPLVEALGWRPEEIAVKWRDGDVVLFKGLPRTQDRIAFVFEVVGLGGGVAGTRGQTLGYVSGCQGHPGKTVITDGIRYRLYSPENPEEPIAYANLSLLKRGALEFFVLLRRPGEGAPQGSLA